MSKNIILVHEMGSDTIRQMPQNYLVAGKIGNRWVVDPDMQADPEVCSQILSLLFNHELRYGSGKQLLNAYYEKM